MDGAASVEKRLVVDVMLGKLAKWLRVLGFDARSENLVARNQIDEFLDRGLAPVTRNQRWADISGVFCLGSNDPMEQLAELIDRAEISRQEVRLLHRCLPCNRELANLNHERAFGLVPDYIFETITMFRQCPACERVYWRGSHPGRIAARLNRILGWTFQ